MPVVADRSGVFRAIADPTRRAILELLHQSDRTVVELARPFEMSRPAISQHLRVLRDAGLVRARSAGRQQIYRIHRKPLEAVQSWAGRLIVDPVGHAWNIGKAGPSRR